MKRKLNLTMYLATLFFLSSFAACTLSVKKSNDKEQSDKWKADHVIFVGFDGWGSYSVEKSQTPNIKYLMDNGSYTQKKRTVLPSSSAVNWASMFMGAGPELHGYTDWGSQKPDLPSRELNKNGYSPIFSQC